MPEKNIKEIEAPGYNKLFAEQLLEDGGKRRLKNQFNRSQLYEIAASFLPKDKDVLEIGCGDGFLTRFLDKQGYIGIDFCDVLIKHGRKLYPNRTFIIDDIRKSHIKFTKNKSYVCLEVLEHINDDLKIIEKIPTNADFVFSAPSADNDFHVRYFTSFDEIKTRYENHLEFLNQDKMETNYGNCIRILKTKRK